MGNHEVEIKRLLADDDAAERFIAALGAPVRAEKRQVNAIFDTEDGRLANASYMLRLRIEDASAFLTAKGPARTVSATTASRIEAETAIAPDVVDDLLGGDVEPLCLLRSHVADETYAELWRGLDEARACRVLRCAGRFENLRRVVDVTLPSGLALTVEVDRTEFPNNRTDNEIEIEVSDEDLVEEVEEWLEALTREAGIETTPSSPKLTRFFEAGERA
ncbi:MAG: hypothetical protein QOF69_1016 [Solirubrobacteraceae bacterium]|nr:hypothetical protein [Solirubrobacteraceae bacterium]